MPIFVLCLHRPDGSIVRIDHYYTRRDAKMVMWRLQIGFYKIGEPLLAEGCFIKQDVEEE